MSDLKTQIETELRNALPLTYDSAKTIIDRYSNAQLSDWFAKYGSALVDRLNESVVVPLLDNA